MAELVVVSGSRRRYAVFVTALVIALGSLAFRAERPVASPSNAQVERGRYLARMGDCEGCHSTAGGAPFAGGRKIGTPFGFLLSSNITPDKETGIGTWSFADFYRAMHLGHNKKNQYLFPAMPYTFYTRVTEEDVAAIWAYMQTVKPVAHDVDVDQLKFPFDIRLSMLGWNELFFRPGTYRPDSAQSREWNRGAYLVEGLGHCSACHSPRNVLGGIEKSAAFTGAEIDSWWAPNLTESLRTGLGTWTVDDIATYLRTGHADVTHHLQLTDDAKGYPEHQETVQAGQGAVGPMALVWHDSLRFSTPADAKAIAVYLKALPARAPAAAGSPENGPTALGARLYIENCAGCHQPSGTGYSNAQLGPALAGNPLVVAPNPDSLLSVMLGGQKAAHNALPMPTFRSEFSDAEVAAVATYVRTHWGNRASEVTSGQVAAFRKKYPRE